jgi:CMP-N,N'-diacetyllegionaminic acid synthase
MKTFVITGSNGLIEKALNILTSNPDCSSVRSVALVEEHPYRCWKKYIVGSIRSVFDSSDELYNLSHQKLPEYYYQIGDIKLVRRSTLLSGSVSGSSVYPLLINHDQVFDIDTVADLQKAEQHLDKLYKS